MAYDYEFPWNCFILYVVLGGCVRNMGFWMKQIKVVRGQV